MDQMKIGSFIKELRKEKDMTQEQLAEKLGTSRRTVSRWETGTNMPDLDIIVELADFFSVDIRELFEGQRKETGMNALEETVIKAAEYTNAENSRITWAALVYFIFGFIALLVHEVLVMGEYPSTFFIGFMKGSTFGLAMASMGFGIVFTIRCIMRLDESRRRIFAKIQKKSQE